MSAADDDLERRRLRGAIGGLARSAKLTPEQRAESARLAGIASGEARRKAREAEGRPVTQRKRNNMPPIEALEPYLETIDAEPRDTPWTYEQRIREAVVRYRRDIATAALEAAKRRAGE